ncbi:MAG: hypothetical protein NTY55_03020 [Flavobacteriia bacterium]|nr:hypothetical protein [Flavobacteriia bacterium]
MDTGTLTVIIFISGTIFAIFGYFLRMIHADVRKNTEEIGKAKGKIELVQQETQIKYQALQELTQLEIKNLAKNVGELSEAVRLFVSKN